MPDEGCYMHAVVLDVDMGGNMFFKFPDDFNSRLSWMINKSKTKLLYRITSAFAQLREHGFVTATRNVFSASQFFRSRMTRSKCEKEFQTRIRTPEYNQALGKLNDLTTLFLALLIGWGVGLAVAFGEGVAGCGGCSSAELDRLAKRERINKIMRRVEVENFMVDEVYARLRDLC